MRSTGRSFGSVHGAKSRFDATLGIAPNSRSRQETARVFLGLSRLMRNFSRWFGIRRRSSVGYRIGQRRKQVWFFAALAGMLARLRTVIVAELHQRPRLRDDRNQPVIDRFRRNRLDQIFVDPAFHGFQHPPTPALS